jgi:DNA-binding transcriptional MerR regulator
MYQIGEFSKINRITVKALRYYDRVGLLKPAFVDDNNGYRYYSSEQLPIIHKIIALRQMDFSINEILDIINGENDNLIFKIKKEKILNDIRAKKEQLSQITHYLEKNREGFKMNYEVVLKELPEVIVYAKKMVVPNYDYYFEAIPKIGEEISKANPNLKSAKPEYCFTIYLDGEYKEENFKVEFCEAVTGFGEKTEEIKFKEITKVDQAACVFYKGSYDNIGEAYAHLFKWIEDNNFIPSDNPRESYIDGIWNKENPSDWLTEIQIPVKKKI